MSLESRIKQARKTAGFSQKILADKLAITGRTLQRYEKDASKMPIEVMTNISFLCAADLTWLITGKGQMHEENDTVPDSEKGINSARVIVGIDRDSSLYVKKRCTKKDPYSSGKIPPIGKSGYDSAKMPPIDKDPYSSGKIPDSLINSEYMPVDLGLLEDIIAATEKYLSENKHELSPSKKAELIVLLYERFDMTEDGFEYGTFERFMRLATK